MRPLSDAYGCALPAQLSLRPCCMVGARDGLQPRARQRLRHADEPRALAQRHLRAAHLAVEPRRARHQLQPREGDQLTISSRRRRRRRRRQLVGNCAGGWARRLVLHSGSAFLSLHSLSHQRRKETSALSPRQPRDAFSQVCPAARAPPAHDARVHLRAATPRLGPANSLLGRARTRATGRGKGHRRYAAQ